VDKEFDLDRVSSTKFVNSQHTPTVGLYNMIGHR